MVVMPGYEKIGRYVIYLDQMYFLTYTGGTRELAAMDQREYNKIINLPLLLQRQELKKIPFEKNPNVIPLKGSMLMSFIRELKFTPLFDEFFDQSHLLKLSDPIIYESIKQKNYDIAMRGM
jgi:hypothetical protein